MAAKDYVWGVKGVGRVANQYKLTTVTLKRLIKEEVQAVLDEKKKKKTKVSKAGQKRVSKKIAILRRKEKMPVKQAAVVAYSMEKSGRLGKHGQYKKKERKKK
jgi:hypothetical protein